MKTKEEIEKDFPKQKSLLSLNKEKEYNKNHSAKRIIIEHAICRLKKFKIMEDLFRNRLRKYDRI